MSSLQVKNAKITAIPETESRLATSVLLPLDNKKGVVFGTILFLGELDEARTQIMNTILEHLEGFRHEAIQKNAARTFEHYLQKINDAIFDDINKSKKISIMDFHCVIGIQTGAQIFVTGIGNLHALFLHKTAHQRFAIYELDKQFAAEEQGWKKAFVTVLDGELHDGDIFYIAPRLSPREISLGDLQDILVTLPPSGALKRIHQFLNKDTVYSAICFQTTDNDKEIKVIKKVNPMTSIKELEETQKKADNLLGEQTPDIKNLVQKTLQPVISKISQPGSKGTKATMSQILIFILKIFTGLFYILTIILKKLWKLILSFASVSKTGYKNIKQGPSTKERISGQKEKIQNFFNRMPRISKYILVASFILIISLSVTVYYLHGKKEQKLAKQEIETIANRIEEKRDAANAALIYDNTTQAKTYAQEALALLETLDPNYKNYDSLFNESKTELESILLAIRGVEEINITKLASSNSKLISASKNSEMLITIAQDNKVLKFNESENKFDEILLNTEGVAQITLFTVINDTELIAIDRNKQMIRIDLEAQTVNQISSGTNKLESVDGILTYNDNLYILSSIEEQILKMRPRNNGYEAGTPWIKAISSSIKNANSIVIDGDIYLINNKQIIKFTSGKELPFTLPDIEPRLQNPTQIWTDIDSQYLYILEPELNRVVVITKDGTIVTQFENDLIGSSISLTVNEEEQTIYIFTDDGLHSFEATHLSQKN